MAVDPADPAVPAVAALVAVDPADPAVPVVVGRTVRDVVGPVAAQVVVHTDARRRPVGHTERPSTEVRRLARRLCRRIPP